MSDTATEVQVCSQHDDNDNNQPRFDSVWSETTYSSTSFEWSVNWKLQFLNLPHTFFIIVTSTESVKDTLRSVCNRQKHIKQRPVFKSATPACSSTAKPKAHSNLPPPIPMKSSSSSRAELQRLPEPSQLVVPELSTLSHSLYPPGAFIQCLNQL